MQSDGQELLEDPFARRREVLEALFADHSARAAVDAVPVDHGACGRGRAAA
ncbi:hypothetical protein [Streptomyces sp. NPDC053728]|uniref:hypothetical protein n=1 Tax=Streptomyces sp. NPDC053728 TaxID=3155534 RepID=UPI0034281E7C